MVCIDGPARLDFVDRVVGRFEVPDAPREELPVEKAGATAESSREGLAATPVPSVL